MATLQVKITDNADDGYEYGASVYINQVWGGSYSGSVLYGFFRFLNVTVPQGATVSAATLTLNIADIGGTPDTTLYGVDADNAAAFANPGNLPSAATKTTASADPDPAATGTKVITITTIVQEIVDRAGWASGNAMAFVVDDNAGGTHYWLAGDYVTANEATLDITYTEPNTAPTITAGPTTTYASGTCTTPTVTWGVTFTATDSEQTGADALTYYIRTSSTFGAGTQVATGTCTSGASKVVTGLAYNASGVVEGTQTLYLHIYDGALNTVTASSFTLVRRFIKSTAGTGGTLSGVLSRAPIYGKAIAGAISSISGALSRVTGKALAGSTGATTGALNAIKTYFKQVTGAISSATGAIVKRTNKTLTGSPASMSASIAKAIAKSFTGSVGSISGSFVKRTRKTFTGSPTSIYASTTKTVSRLLNGTSGSVSAALTSIKIQFISISGSTASITGSLLANTTYARAIAGELLSLTGNVSRMTLKALSGSSGAVLGALSSTRLYTKTIAGEIATISSSITRFVTKSFSGVITGSGILSTASSFYRTVTGSLSSLSGSFSFRSIIRRVKMKGGSVVRSVISGGSRILR